MKNKQGLIQLIIILILFVVILSLLGVSLSDLFQNKIFRDNFAFVWDGLNYIWERWLANLFWSVWPFLRDFFVDFVWKPFIQALQTIKSGGSPFEVRGIN